MQGKWRRVQEIQGYELGALDGGIGKCQDFLFDDEEWAVRYIVADTRKWLPGRKVLISPISLGAVDRKTHTLEVGLTKEQIKSAPPLESHAPVSRQYETLYNKYYGWPAYWEGAFAWGPHPLPRQLQGAEKLEKERELLNAENTMRSTEEVMGYHIQATDTDIGHIEDFVVEDESWIIRYLVIDTSNWLPGSKRVIVAPTWVDMVDWGRRVVVVKMTKEQIESCPEFDTSMDINREYEETIFDYYGYPHYW
ncbi:MAG: PRC-barrel domain-containing protein [Desulforhopalus sp.]